MKRLACVGLGLLAGVAVGGLLWGIAPREPKHEGRPLSAWLEDVASASPQRREQAWNAVRHIGPTSIPHLIEHLREGSNQERRLHLQAVKAFQLLGGEAAPAIPELARLLENPPTGPDAARALAGIGAASVPVLVEALHSAKPHTQLAAVFGLSLLGPDAKPAVGPLLACLEEAPRELAAKVLNTLGGVQAEPQAVLPAAGARLTHPDWQVRVAAAEVLGAYRGQAGETVPALVKMAREDKHAWARDAAVRALYDIDAEAARRAGIVRGVSAPAPGRKAALTTDGGRP